MRIVGIDLGTTNSCVAVLEGGERPSADGDEQDVVGQRPAGGRGDDVRVGVDGRHRVGDQFGRQHPAQLVQAMVARGGEAEGLGQRERAQGHRVRQPVLRPGTRDRPAPRAAVHLAGSDVGLAGATSVVTESTPRPPRAAGQVITDEGDGADQLARYLIGQKLI